MSKARPKGWASKAASKERLWIAQMERMERISDAARAGASVSGDDLAWLISWARGGLGIAQPMAHPANDELSR